MSYRKIQIPAGDRIVADASGKLQVPDHPIIGFIEGDGIGPDITRASINSPLIPAGELNFAIIR